MGINLTNFLSSQSKNTKMIDFQDLDHIDGLSISVLSANLYKNDRPEIKKSLNILQRLAIGPHGITLWWNLYMIATPATPPH